MLFSFHLSSLEDLSKYSGSQLSENSPVLRQFSLCSVTDSEPVSEECGEYGSVLLDIVSGTAHWSPEAPRRAITPDRNIAIFQGQARHCKISLSCPLAVTIPHKTPPSHSVWLLEVSYLSLFLCYSQPPVLSLHIFNMKQVLSLATHWMLDAITENH